MIGIGGEMRDGIDGEETRRWVVVGVGSGVGVHDACSVDFVDVSKHGNTAPVTHEDREHQDADYMVDTFAHFELMLLLLYIYVSM